MDTFSGEVTLVKTVTPSEKGSTLKGWSKLLPNNVDWCVEK